MINITKYPNRRLYYHERHCYTTLRELRSLIESGERIRVIERRSGTDITKLTLLNMLVDREEITPRLALEEVERLLIPPPA